MTAALELILCVFGPKKRQGMLLISLVKPRLSFRFMFSSHLHARV